MAIYNPIEPGNLLQIKIAPPMRSCWITQDRSFFINELEQYEKLLILVDSKVQKYAETLFQDLKAPSRIMVLDGGESLKHLDLVESLSESAVDFLNRKGALIAVGGGALGDLAGFLASILFRSIPCYLIPTTLLSMVDAAIGGKTAINLKKGKNLLGTFSLPAGVLIDPGSLTSLPKEQWYAGFGEVLKTSILHSDDFFQEVLEILEIWHPGIDILPIIEQCTRIKKAIVEDDFWELGKRKLLNLGHTVGHALEAYYQYQVPHGICVWMGLILEARLGRNLGLVDKDLWASLESTSKYLPIPIFKDDPGVLIPFMERDKKNQAGRIVFIFMQRPGIVAKKDTYITELDSDVLEAYWEGNS